MTQKKFSKKDDEKIRTLFMKATSELEPSQICLAMQKQPS